MQSSHRKPGRGATDEETRLIQTAIDLFRRPSPSRFEGLVRDYVISRLEPAGFKIRVDKIGNVLATRGTPKASEGYPLLSFHMDIVSRALWDDLGLNVFGLPSWDVQEIQPTHNKEKRRARRRRTRSISSDYSPLELLPTSAVHIENGRIHSGGDRVLGGDDRCGASIALTLADATTCPLKIIASVQEEIGCIGISNTDPRFFNDASYALVLDRRGATDLIISIFGRPLCQSQFAQAMVQAAAAVGHTARPTEGVTSDAVVLAGYVLNVVNMSVGYYHPHTVDEFVDCFDLIQAYHWAKEALLRLPRLHPDGTTLVREKTALAEPAIDDDVLCPHCENLIIAMEDLTEDLLSYACFCNVSLEEIPRWVKVLWGMVGERGPL